jgi:hypothetical protein
MQTHFPAASGWKNNYWPGAEVALAGITFTHYSGFNTRITDTTAFNYKGGGRYWNLGYTWAKQKRIQAPLLRRLNFSLGLGFGGFRLHGSTGETFSVRPGVAVKLFHVIEVFADLHAGYTFLNHPLIPYMQPIYPGADLAIQHFYYAPSFGIRFLSKLSESRGEDIETEDRVGSYHEYDHSDGVYDYFKIHYYSGHLTLPSSNNIFNFCTKLFIPRADDIQNWTYAGAIGFNLRIGLLALDIEHARGHLGFEDDRHGSGQDHWNFNYTNIGFGVNFINIIKPAGLPSLYRVIMGYKVGVGSFQSEHDRWSSSRGYAPEYPAVVNEKVGHWYYSFEFGRFAMGVEKFSLKKQPNRYSNVFNVSYFFPLYKVKS